MLTITIKDPATSKYYKARVSISWAKRHDNGRLISCGLTIDEKSAYDGTTVYLTRGGFERLKRTRPTAVREITALESQHSGCLSSCILRGADRCSW